MKVSSFSEIEWQEGGIQWGVAFSFYSTGRAGVVRLRTTVVVQKDVMNVEGEELCFGTPVRMET
jgi:hypothetical protein